MIFFELLPFENLDIAPLWISQKVSKLDQLIVSIYVMSQVAYELMCS